MDGLRLVLGDSIEEMDKLPEKSVNLIVCDPPYNISKADWDKFKADEYIDYMGKVFNACHRVLADNGVLYWFHSDMAQVSRLMEKIREDGQFSYNSFITLDKGDWRAQAWKNPSKDNNLRSWFNTCEYLLCYTNKASTHTEWDKTGWDRVRLDTDHFTTLRKYAYDVLLFIGGGNYSSKDINRILGHRHAEHFFYCQPRPKEGL